MMLWHVYGYAFSNSKIAWSINYFIIHICTICGCLSGDECQKNIFAENVELKTDWHSSERGESERCELIYMHMSSAFVPDLFWVLVLIYLLSDIWNFLLTFSLSLSLKFYRMHFWLHVITPPSILIHCFLIYIEILYVYTQSTRFHRIMWLLFLAWLPSQYKIYFFFVRRRFWQNTLLIKYFCVCVCVWLWHGYGNWFKQMSVRWVRLIYFIIHHAHITA